MARAADLLATGAGMDRQRLVLAGLGLLALAAVACFMLLGVRGNWAFVLPFRATKLLGLVLVAYSIAVSTVLFQTVTNNRILTPAIMGFDTLFILIQTVVIFFFTSRALATVDPRLQFLLQVAVMVGFSLLLFRWLFAGGERSLHLLVLVGIVFGVFFRSVANLMQRMMDPNEFLVLQDSFFASFNTIDRTLLATSVVVVALASLALWRLHRSLDVVSLGRATAIGLGVDYKATVLKLLVIMAVLVSVSTALVGPVTFFGLLVVSLAHALAGDGRHRHILPASILIAVICLVGGQTLMERVFSFGTALSIIIEFLGGLVFIGLILRGAAR
ncbi:iron chelate uptake ABC transporter family permease subunit [Luteimonas sp. JM171]|uniref:iron chelate uptake ABC transporter family permease subunit n=1 Tax=Luteimonas sp. JM171 TaxID=1896164 RepID=UPI0019138209|nr:iron chelate uptake ABC transporter family permease subunit [Luteimonas sp. JM171]